MLEGICYLVGIFNASSTESATSVNALYKFNSS